MHDAGPDSFADPSYVSYPVDPSGSAFHEQTAYPNMGGYNNEYPPQPYGQYPPQPYAGDMAGAAGMGAGATAGVAGAAAAAGVAAGAVNLQDGSMVRVKVGFVRSLEDELGKFALVQSTRMLTIFPAVTVGQQLFLHTAYDDGWSLCEDQAQNRGVVPVSCLEPWDDNANNNLVPR